VPYFDQAYKMMIEPDAYERKWLRRTARVLRCTGNGRGLVLSAVLFGVLESTLALQ